TIFLRWDPTASEESWTALTVMSGTAKIRRLRFELDPGAADNLHMTAIGQQGGQVILENCTFLQEERNGPGPGRMASVTVSGPWSGEDRLNLSLNGCYFARGQYAISLTRAAEVRARQCAFGPHTAALFDVEGQPSPNTSTNVTLQNCSAFV